MRVITLLLLISTSALKAEERLSWFTKDAEIRKSIFVPENLPEGKEESRTLPWVFHDEEQTKVIKLNCMMRGYNVTNNPIDYKDARWSHPGFDDSQVNTAFNRKEGNESGVPYAIWTIEVDTSATAPGKKWATCEFQQGDFPLSIDLEFLIFRRVSKESLGNGTALMSYGLDDLEEKDLTLQIEEDIKRQIGENYGTTSSNVTRDGMIFTITVPDPDTTATTTTTTTPPQTPSTPPQTPPTPSPTTSPSTSPTTTATSTTTTTTTTSTTTTSTASTTTTTTTSTKPAPASKSTDKDNNDTIIALIIFLVSILLLVIVCGFVRAFKERMKSTCYKFGFLKKDPEEAKLYEEHNSEDTHEKDELCDNNTASVGYFETKYSILSENQVDGNGNTINVIDLLSDPKKRFEADKIKEEWRQITHRPTLSEVKQAALLAWEGYLTSLEFMNIRNMDITEILRDQMNNLTSIVTKRVMLENITNIELSSILASVTATRLLLLNVELSEEDTRALVTAMRVHLEEVWLENVTLNIEQLCQYEGLGKCRELTVCGDTRRKYESCLRSWAAQKRWILTLDYDEMLMMEKALARQ